MILRCQEKSLTHNKKVIPFRESKQAKPPPWKFEDFGYSKDSNPIQEWLDEQSEEAEETFNSVLKDMSTTESHTNWGAWRRLLKGEASKHRIWEIGFKAEGRQYRVMGVFAGRKMVILLTGCYHKGNVYTPHNAIQTAIDRAKALKEGTATTHARQIRMDS